MSFKFKPWLVLGVIFIVGILTGSALTIGLGPHFRHPPRAGEMKKRWLMHLAEQLKLTADQQAKIEPILTDAESQIQSVHREEVSRGSQIIKAANDQISALLTPEQKVELQKMESDREKMFSGHMRFWGPPREGMRHHDGPGGGRVPPDAPTNAAP